MQHLDRYEFPFVSIEDLNEDPDDFLLVKLFLHLYGLNVDRQADDRLNCIAFRCYEMLSNVKQFSLAIGIYRKIVFSRKFSNITFE